MSRPPVVCVVGKKKSGKTTTVVGLVAELVGRGHRVMTAKHGHRFRLDTPGTDSWRHREEAGAERVVLAGPEGLGVWSRWGGEGEVALETLVERYLGDADVVVAEGFKTSGAPRIEVYRRAAHRRPLYRPDHPQRHLYLAILTDADDFEAEVPVLDADAPERFRLLADLVETRVMGR